MLQSLEDLLPQKVKLQGFLQELQACYLFYATFLSQENPSTYTMYVVNEKDNTISVTDMNSNIIITIPVGTKPTDIALTPDRKYAYVTNSVGSSLSLIDTSSNKVINTILLDTNPGYTIIHPNGKTAYVANINHNLVSIIDLTNNHLASMFPGAPNPQGIALTPDSKYIYILSRDNLPN